MPHKQFWNVIYFLICTELIDEVKIFLIIVTLINHPRTKSPCMSDKSSHEHIELSRRPKNNKVKVVTVLLENFVFIVPNQVPDQGNCLNGIPCKVNAR